MHVFLKSQKTKTNELSLTDLNDWLCQIKHYQAFQITKIKTGFMAQTGASRPR